MELILKGLKRPFVIQCGATEIQKLFEVKEGTQLRVILPEQVESKPAEKVQTVTTNTEVQLGKSYIIKVRQYMTRSSKADFDFMRQWNNDVPMPFRVMVGTVIRETRGMVMMDLHCIPLETSHCMRCGKELTHPVSKLYGIGPECGGHAHINPFNTIEELKAALEEVRAKLSEIKWRGWIIKTSITEATEVEGG